MGMFKSKGDGDMNNLKKARIRKGYTQKFVADNAGIATRAYVRYESEKENRDPDAAFVSGGNCGGSVVLPAGSGEE